MEQGVSRITEDERRRTTVLLARRQAELARAKRRAEVAETASDAIFYLCFVDTRSDELVRHWRQLFLSLQELGHAETLSELLTRADLLPGSHDFIQLLVSERPPEALVAHLNRWIKSEFGAAVVQELKDYAPGAVFCAVNIPARMDEHRNAVDGMPWASTFEEIRNLEERHYECLQALRDLEAVSAQTRRLAEKIAEKAGGPGKGPAYVKEHLGALVKVGLVESKDGRGGGYWLTKRGLDLVNHTRPEKR